MIAATRKSRRPVTRNATGMVCVVIKPARSIAETYMRTSNHGAAV
jgi:hypothetical protein